MQDKGISKSIVGVSGALATIALLTGCDMNPSEPILDGNIQSEAEPEGERGKPADADTTLAPQEVTAEPEASEEGPEDE